MKKSILTIALGFIIAINSAFAGTTEGVNQKVINGFKKDYSTATDVRWEISKDYYKATFTNAEQVLYAYYNAEGARIAVMRNVRSNQLPLKVSEDLRKHQDGRWITDLFEFSSQEESGYYATLENAEEKVVLKSTDGSSWIVFSKEEKK